MRGTRRLTRAAWFGPKRYPGWGLSPRTWQGWTVTAVFVAAIVAAGSAVRDRGTLVVVEGTLIVLFILVTVLTGDGPGTRR